MPLRPNFMPRTPIWTHFGRKKMTMHLSVSFLAFLWKRMSTPRTTMGSYSYWDCCHLYPAWASFGPVRVFLTVKYTLLVVFGVRQVFGNAIEINNNTCLSRTLGVMCFDGATWKLCALSLYFLPHWGQHQTSSWRHAAFRWSERPEGGDGSALAMRCASSQGSLVPGEHSKV